MKSQKNSLLIACVLAVTSVYGQGLKDYYESYFPVGVAVSPQSLSGKEGEIIKSQFGSLTAENVMKMGLIHPEEDRYNWEPADKIVEFAQANKMKVRGHCLVWHRQTPGWIFKNKDGTEVTKEVLLQRLKDHIYSVVGRYKGKIYAWDVVNEAVSDNAGEFYRQSPWFKICGEEFIAKAFQYAHEADPDAILFYNDYGLESSSKLEKIYKLISALTDASVPIHAIGSQGHWSIYGPAIDEISATFSYLGKLGLPIQITELDLSVYREKSDTQIDYTPGIGQKQADVYRQLFELFRNNKNLIKGVTFWGVSDKDSWLNNFPTKGRKNYPLLLDDQLRLKEAFFVVAMF